MLLDRRPRGGGDPFLDWKVRLFFAGAALFALAVVLDRPVLVLAAGAVLVAAFVLRFFAPREEEPEYVEEEEEEVADETPADRPPQG
ncbi:MAG TPA: hypothetical protein VHG91_19200 [Longimicrobium sp.]|nr:hypothetical protein [Longimicrobium sp.]